MGIAEDFIIVIVAGLAAGLIASRLKLPPILGYIIAGIAIGPHTGIVSLANIHDVELLAEIGVALLLFSIGLDFSVEELKEVRAVALVGGPIQVLATIAYGIAVGRFAGIGWTPSIVLGCIMSLSSTMAVFKTLMNRGLTGTLSSRVMIGILIMQDLAAIPMMIVIPHLAGIGTGFAPLGLLALKAAIFLILVALLGSRAVPSLFRMIASLRSRELFIVSVAAVGLGIGYATYRAGLSFAFGAFVAGMVLNRSDYSRQALSDVIPLRDVFSLIFFTSIGMLFDYRFVMSHLANVAVLSLLVIFGKGAIMFFIPLAFGYRNIVPIASALTLSQIGEFSFVLARSGLRHGVLGEDLYATVISVTVATMFITPFLAMLAAPLYSIKKKLFRREPVQTYNYPAEGIRDHVIIAGGGRIGKLVAQVLASRGLPLVVIEQDFRRFEEIQALGHPIIFGDAAQGPVIEAAGVRDARVLLVTVPNPALAREICASARSLNKGIFLVARAASPDDIEELRDIGVNAVIQPEMEASVEIVRRLLLCFDVPLATAQNCAESIRCAAGIHPDPSVEGMRSAAYLLELEWVEVPAGSAAVGRSIGELRIRTDTGASVVGIYRGTSFLPNPGPEEVFTAGDVAAVIGTPEGRRAFARLVCRREGR